MTQQYPPNQFPQASTPRQVYPKPPKDPRKRWGRGQKIAAGVLAGFIVFIVGWSAGAGSTTDITSSSPQPTITKTVTAAPSSTQPPATTQPPAPKFGIPAVKDFKLTVKTLTKQCFGSAGCNLTYRILVAYNGPTMDPSKTYEVLYEVRGGEDGPIANKLTIENGVSSVDEEEMASTTSSRTKLTAVVTDVMAP